MDSFLCAKFEISLETQENISISENSTERARLSQNLKNLNIEFSVNVPSSKMGSRERKESPKNIATLSFDRETHSRQFKRYSPFLYNKTLNFGEDFNVFNFDHFELFSGFNLSQPVFNFSKCKNHTLN